MRRNATFKREVDWLLIEEEEGKSHYVLTKDFDTFIYNQILHPDRKHICCYCLQSYTAAQIFQRHVNDKMANQILKSWNLWND